MNKNTNLRNGGYQSITPDKMLKATSVIYLKEALINEQFEKCAELIQVAKTFGVQQRVIDRILAEYARGVQAGQQYEANVKVRCRQLKGK